MKLSCVIPDASPVQNADIKSMTTVCTAPPLAVVEGKVTEATQLVGPLPGELGSMTQFSGGIGAESASANASKALIDFLAGQEAGSRFKAKGFEPGG